MDMYVERRPSGARGRSISLSSLRGHRVAATPLRDTRVVAGREVGGGGGGGCVADLQGVASEGKRLSLTRPPMLRHVTPRLAR